MTRPALVFVTVLATLAPVRAQDSGTAAAQVSFRVTRFDPADNPPPEFKAGSDAGQVDLEIPLTYIDGPFKASLRDEQFLDFRRPGQEQPEISVTIGPNERKGLLLVFFPEKKSFQVLKINAAQAKLKGGDRYIFNVTASPLTVELGEAKPVLIPPKKAGIVASPPGDGVQTLPVSIKQKDGDQWKLVSTEFWNCDPRFRKYLFVYTSPRNRRIAFHGVSERL